MNGVEGQKASKPMDAIVAVEVIGVLSAWVVLGYTIWRWGPGRVRRSVRCPVRKARAKVQVEQRESEFGRLYMADVNTCSLFPDSPPDCGKECLTRF